MYGANEAAVLEDTALPRYIRITDVKADGTLHDDTFRSLEEEVAAPFLLRDGDILLARSGATVGKSFQYLESWGRAAYAGYLIRFRPDKSVIFPRFANYYFQTECYWACIRSTLIQATIENFSAEKYKDLALPMPTTDEQQQIAAFLDWKTGQIDALIAKKKELMEKLKEKRLAAITQAVTKGLNPAAPLRDSGIPWLGQVPKHWEVKRLRRVVDHIEQGWSPECSNTTASSDEWGVVKAGCCNGGRFNPDENKALPSHLTPPESLEIKEGDLLMSRASGSEELIGSAAVVPSSTRRLLLLSDKTYRLLYDRELVSPAFLALALQCPIGRFQIQAVISGALGLAKNIAQSDVKDLLLAFPPICEQEQIATLLQGEMHKLDSLTESVTSAITRLTEYRTALITAATTGKIDVRGLAIPARNRD